jgi:hypothetical protein
MSQIQVLFGPNAGANVQIKVSDSATPPSAGTAGSLPTVAQATDVSGEQTLRVSAGVDCRYIVVWITKLPPRIGDPGQYQAEIYNIVIRGSA